MGNGSRREEKSRADACMDAGWRRTTKRDRVHGQGRWREALVTACLNARSFYKTYRPQWPHLSTASNTDHRSFRHATLKRIHRRPLQSSSYCCQISLIPIIILQNLRRSCLELLNLSCPASPKGQLPSLSPPFAPSPKLSSTVGTRLPCPCLSQENHALAHAKCTCFL